VSSVPPPSADDADHGRDAPELTPPPAASEVLGAALGAAARRAGLDPSKSDQTGHVVWHAMGGWRGIAESVIPSLAFLVAYTVSKDLVLSLVVSVGLAVVFTAIRLIARQPAGAAIGGLVAAGIAAALALWTGRAEDNFLWGFLTNGAYGLALLVSALVRWPIIGLAGGWLMNEGTAWRADRRKRRTYFWLTIAWAGLFAARLAVQLPLYFAAAAAGAGTDANVALTGALGATKLIMGIPLFAPMVAVTWLAVRALYPKAPAASAATPE
jgi:hypothetical protein